MPSTYSNIKIQLMGTGENTTTWGDVTNVNLGTALEEAITGSADVPFSSADVTLTLSNTNAAQTARNLRLNLTGTSGGARFLYLSLPSADSPTTTNIEKAYIINNGLADAVTVRNKINTVAAGASVVVPAGKTMWVYDTGTDIVDAVTHLSSLTLGTPLPISSGGTGSSAALTQGSVVFAGVGGVYSQDNANFFWDDTNNRLGIGTATPASSLNILGDQILAGAAGTAVLGLQLKGPAISAIPSAQVQGYIATGDSSIGVAGDLLIAPRTDATANVRFITGTSPAERMRITAAGDVGIGTSSPLARLNIIGGNANSVRVDNGGQQFTSVDWYNNLSSKATVYYDNVAAEFVSRTTSAAALGFDTNLNRRMTITSTGDVGIGTSSPGNKLAVAGGQINTVADGSYAFAFNATTGNTRIIPYSAYYSGSALVAYNAGYAANGPLAIDASTTTFWISGTERMRITSAGDVGIGTITPQSKLHVSGGYITAGNVSSTAGSKIIGGDYSGAEHITTFGSEFSSGGPVVGYGVWPSTSAALAFVSSAAPALQRSAYTQTGNNHVWFTGASQTVAVGSPVTMSERMRLDGSGNLGLGTAPSGARLDVNGNIRTTLGSGGTLSLFETDAVRANQLFSGADASGSFINATFSTGGTATLRLQTANNEHMRINGAGNVGIGTISPATRLHVAGITRISDATNSTAVNIDASTTAGLTSIIAQFGGSQLAFGAAGAENFRITSTGGITSSNLADAVGYKGIPQNNQTSGYTLALSDMGKHISITTGGVTIPANGAVAFPIGSAVTIFNNSGSNQTISITTDTLRQAGTANTGSRTLAQYGVATVLKVTSTVWVISGAGLS